MRDGRISNQAQVASLRRYTLKEGQGAGLDVIDCDNGKIRFLLNVTKALDIMQVYKDGKNISFLSKNAFIAQNLPFPNRFEGGMLYTCGLDSAGAQPGFELHGTFHKTVAEVTRAECGETEICVEAMIRNSELFGKNLVMKRRIRSEIGSNQLILEDKLINESFRDEKYCILYHVNLGYPMLDEGGKIHANVLSATPRNEWAEKHMDEMFDITAPTPNMEETCYYLKLAEKKVKYTNEKSGKSFTLEYEGDALTDFTEWKSMACCDYALGLEPTTTTLDGDFTLKILPAGQAENFKLTMTID